MISNNIKYVSGRDGQVREVILPIDIFHKMVEELENKELLNIMKNVEKQSADYLSEEESFNLLDDLISNNEIQTQ